MSKQRLTKHPVMAVGQGETVTFSWNKKPLQGMKGEMVSSALFANGIQVFGHHTKDHSAQGMFCANGQCSQCLVMADGLPAKSCMTPLKQGMVVESMEGLPRVPEADDPIAREDVVTREVGVLIIGGGPAGLSAAIELGKLGVDTLIIDDKNRLGGKLVLQTHKFFGSVEDSWAGTRGFDIGHILADEVALFPTVETWLETRAVGVFSDGVVGVVQKNKYVMIKPQKVLVATGAREKMLPFPGNTLPGVYGAGAFQTLVNRDLIKASERVLIVGGGNVGIIAGYHALQADIEVVAVIEGLPEVGGYKVHADKLKRLGVPIFTRHTVVSANGKDRLESVTMAAIDDHWKVIPGTEKTVEVDTLLIAVGLSPVDEFFHKAKEWGMDVYSAGDAQEIAEASAAMFTGKIEGVRIGKSLGVYEGEIPQAWLDKASVLKSRPGEIKNQAPSLPAQEGVMPVFHCTQEIPCNPCTSICPEHIIKTEKNLITGLPHVDAVDQCKGCLNCVAICPGLAVSVVDYRKDKATPTVTLPYEMGRDAVEKGTMITVTDVDGAVIGDYPVQRVVVNKKKFPGTLMVQIKMAHELASSAIGIKEQKSPLTSLDIPDLSACPDDAIICRCERITAGEIRAAIREGVRDMNQLKGLNRTGMGACGSKTCRPMVMGLFRDEGIDLKEVTDGTHRPLFVEVPFGTLAGAKGGE